MRCSQGSILRSCLFFFFRKRSYFSTWLITAKDKSWIKHLSVSFFFIINITVVFFYRTVGLLQLWRKTIRHNNSATVCRCICGLQHYDNIKLILKSNGPWYSLDNFSASISTRPPEIPPYVRVVQLWSLASSAGMCSRALSVSVSWSHVRLLGY